MPLLSASQLQSFTTQTFSAAGCPASEAQIVAEHLVAANLLGFDSHGVIRIPLYLQWVREGVLKPGAPISTARESETTAIVDCGWNFGQIGALRAIGIAIEKASNSHIAAVATNRCGHSGRLGTYTEMAAERGFVALAFCNSWRGGHFVPPWGGSHGRMATNPMSYAVPCNGTTIVSDFSTAETAEGVIRIYKNQGKPLPGGWIVDADGNATVDPNAFYGPPRGAILPFGGDKGYRGFALGLLVEILAGVLAGGNRLADQDGNGLCFLVINPSAFQSANDFNALMRDTHDYIKSSPPRDGCEVLLPGEPDRRVREKRLCEGIPVDENTWTAILTAADTVGVSWASAAA